MKKANEMFSIEEIEQIMEDTAEAVEKQREIDALLSGQLSSEDEDEVLAELDQLVSAEEESENVTPQQLPDVPTEGETDFRSVFALKTRFEKFNSKVIKLDKIGLNTLVELM